MRTCSIVLLVLAALLAAFAYWGMYTRAGNARFDEMDGIIPWAAGVLSILLFLGAAATWWFRTR